MKLCTVENLKSSKFVYIYNNVHSSWLSLPQNIHTLTKWQWLFQAVIIMMDRFDYHKLCEEVILTI